MDPQQSPVESAPIKEAVQPQKKAPAFWIGLSFLLLCSTLFFAYKYITLTKIRSLSQVNTYEECEKAQGSILAESYPAICITIDGKRFVQPLTDDEKSRLEANSICVYKGVTYQNGQSFKDACNTCSCTSGQIACTLMACAD